jgi:DNA repair protein RecN (Recombination protein N)
MIEEKAYDILGYIFYAAMILLLLITPIVARDIKGSLSWISIGPVSLQPAEFAKCFTAIAVAKYMSRYGYKVQELKDLGATVADDSERINTDPERLQKLTDRVNMIYSLCQKHRVKDLEELMAVGERLQQQLSAITHSDENINAQRELIASLRTRATAIATTLHSMREKAGKELSAEVEAMLQRLGMAEASFMVVAEKQEELLPTGMDRVRFMFSANGGVTPQAVEKVASGGEISRVMLALKALIARRKSLPTIIFDEIDTGVSGRIADAMGEIISSLGENMQVVAITHLPQVASKGESHFVVYKKNSRTNISALDSEQRVMEIAKMLSGSEITDAALTQAKLLLEKK